MARLSTASTATPKNAALGPGVVIANLKDRSLDGIRAVIRKTAPASETGRLLGAMTSVPTVNISPEFQDILEDVVGLNTTLKGAQQIQTTEVTCEAEIVELVPKNLHMIHPALTETAFFNGAAKATLTVGAGAAGIVYTADTGGTAGNSIRVAYVNPGNNGVLAVGVVGSDITVTLATNGTGVVTSTASQVRAAVDASSAASALVDTALVGDGTGVVSAQAMTALSGGTIGTEVGRTFAPKGFVTDADYHKNIVICFESSQTDLFLVIELYNVISTDDVELSADDGGSATGVGVTWTAHADDTSFDMNTGVYAPPYKIHWVAPPVAA